ncbi:hypothetical protein LUZ60_004987 [Juncus effusus]|nr:hypothetical protein LUZ60_004987 [Juncus effusus]
MNAPFMDHMSIPPKFTANFGGQIHEMVKLKGPNGNIWQVGVAIQAEKFVLQFGWKEFALANDIKENDILIFNYNGNSSFQVQILRPNGCERISSFFVEEKWTNLQKVNGPTRNICQHENLSSGSSSDSENHTEQSATSDEKPRQRPKKGTGTSKNQKDGNNCEVTKSEPPFMYVARKLQMTNTEKNEALRLAQEVQPGNPYFVGVINPSCIGFQRSFVLGVPTNFSATYLQRKTQKVVLHYNGRPWEAMYVHTQNRSQIRSNVWKSFVIENNLQEGDVYLFELLKDQNEIISFRVHLSKN